VTILDANADHVIQCVLNSTAAVPTGQFIAFGRTARVRDATEEKAKRKI
jgi:hypothetical protein